MCLLYKYSVHKIREWIKYLKKNNRWTSYFGNIYM